MPKLRKLSSAMAMQLQQDGPNRSDSPESRCPRATARKTEGSRDASPSETARRDSRTGIWLGEGSYGLPPLDSSRTRKGPDSMVVVDDCNEFDPALSPLSPR